MFLSELANAVRTLQRHPAFFVTAAGTLAIGICANVTVSSMVNGVLLRPMPFGERTDRVVALHSTHHLQAEDLDNSGVSSADLLDVRREMRLFEHVGGYIVRNFTVVSGNGAERLMAVSVTPDLFPMLGIEPALGLYLHICRRSRAFGLRDCRHPHARCLAESRRRRPQYHRACGDHQRPRVDGRGCDAARISLPPARAALRAPVSRCRKCATIRTVSGIALMKPAITRQQAQAEVDGVAARLESAFPTTNRGYGIRVVTFATPRWPRSRASR